MFVNSLKTKFYSLANKIYSLNTFVKALTEQIGNCGQPNILTINHRVLMKLILMKENTIPFLRIKNKNIFFLKIKNKKII